MGRKTREKNLDMQLSGNQQFQLHFQDTLQLLHHCKLVLSSLILFHRKLNRQTIRSSSATQLWLLQKIFMN